MEQFGLFNVERYVCEGLPQGVGAFFDARGKAACLDHIKIKGDVVTLHGSAGNWSRVKIKGDSKTPLYLATTDISGRQIIDVVAQSRRATIGVDPRLFPLPCKVGALSNFHG